MTTTLDELLHEIRSVVEGLQNDIIELRRAFHQHPELSWQEHKTASRLVEILHAEGLAVDSSVCGTAVVAELGGHGGKLAALRADMDGLPIQDNKSVSYASRVPGVMHACGHDCHMAMAIGVAKTLKRLKVQLPGSVRFIFQPCEEADPSGAGELVETGVMQDVDAIFAWHVDPTIEVGSIGLRGGLLTANANEFRISISGKSGHAARPHHAVDAVYLANRVLTALYDIGANRPDPYLPGVLTIGKIWGGKKGNVIADRVDIAGTFRTIDEITNAKMMALIERKVKEIVKATGGTYEIHFPVPVPSVFNDHNLTFLARESLRSLLPAERIVDIDKVSMGGEDFSYYLRTCPGLLMRLGALVPDSEVRFLHSSNFDIDERALDLGVCAMTLLLVNFLNKSDGET